MEGYERYSAASQRALSLAQEMALRLRHRAIGAEHILAAVIELEDASVTALLIALDVPLDALRGALEPLNWPGMRARLVEPVLRPEASQALSEAEAEARGDGAREVTPLHMLLGLARVRTGTASSILQCVGVTYERMRAQLGGAQRPGDQAFSAAHLRRYQMTPLLNQVSRDLTTAALGGELDPVIGREAQLDQVMRTLTRRRKNNPMLVGEAGVGKTAIVEALAQAIAAGEAPDALRDKRIVSLDLALLTTGTKFRGDFEERLKALVSETQAAGSVILCIEELPALLGAGGGEGSLNAANLFKPLLARGDIQIIGTATHEDFKKLLERDPALERRFQPIPIPAPDEVETVAILRGLRPRYEAYHGVRLPDETLAVAARLASRYIQQRALPDKAIDLMDEAAARTRVAQAAPPTEAYELRAALASARERRRLAVRAHRFAEAADLRDQAIACGKRLRLVEERWRRARGAEVASVTPRDVAQVVTGWTGIPLAVAGDGDDERFARLHERLSERVIGQVAAVSAVTRSMRRSRADLRDRRRPVGGFVFAGPTGVGKTELARALACALFGSDDALIKLDMSEFMERHATARLVGAPPGYVGYEAAGQLTEAVRRRPFSVVLFDEIEKAHPQAQGLLLQILEDGTLSDARGRTVDFRNTVIILTTNLGAERLRRREGLGFRRVEETGASADDAARAAVLPEIKRVFKPELLNRVDEIIIFHTLTRDDTQRILGLQLAAIQRRLDDRGIRLAVTERAQDRLIRDGYSEEYGARALRRETQTRIEDTLAEALLAGTLAEGDEAIIDLDDAEERYLLRQPDAQAAPVRAIESHAAVSAR
ncbi:MAG TPA: ATP-dependent Clp protease ATP-binding subunit [Ktedonobacterales bacterium]